MLWVNFYGRYIPGHSALCFRSMFWWPKLFTDSFEMRPWKTTVLKKYCSYGAGSLEVQDRKIAVPAIPLPDQINKLKSRSLIMPSIKEYRHGTVSTG
jgi:hypothetical protein